MTIAPTATRIWVAAERLPQLHKIHPDAELSPPINAPAEFRQRVTTRDAALVEIVRSRLEGLGPATTASLAQTVGVASAEIDAALATLAAQGVAMSGQFTPGAPQTEWCDRALLARIHRYTVKRLRERDRAGVHQDFMRFLLRWQHAVPTERRQGPDALDAVIAQLQGFEAPAAAWEAELLPARLDDYDFTWLDDLCFSGRAVWTRLTLPGATTSTASPVRSARRRSRCCRGAWRRCGIAWPLHRPHSRWK